MKVAFLAPHYPPEQRQFTRALAAVGADVIGIADAPRDQIPLEVRRHLAAYLHVPHLFDEERAARTIAAELSKVGVDRVETLWEPLVLLAARIRDLLGMQEMGYDVSLGFRDKQIMKERLLVAGLRVPHARRVRTESEIWAAVREIGYPVCFKPIAGAGSADTFRVDDDARMREVIAQTRHVAEASVEEFVEGEEFTWDCVVIGGEPVFEGICEYLPRPLIARNELWVSPAQVGLRDPAIPHFEGGRALGRGVLQALGMGTGFVHMEWYRKASGEVIFGEIASRNGGGHIVDMHNWANDCDLFEAWARAVCWRACETVPSRRHHVGMVFKRAFGEGRITRVEGVAAVRRSAGPYFLQDGLLPIGAPRRNWKQTLVGDGYLAFRHPDYRSLRQLMDLAVNDVRMFAG